MEKVEIASTHKNDTEGRTLKEEKLKASKLKDEKAIANLKEKIPEIAETFDIHGRIGNGTYGTVLSATLKGVSTTKGYKRIYAIKHLIPTCHPIRIEKELRCLLEIGGVDNVVGIELCLRRKESVAFVMPYLAHENFQDYYDKMNLAEVQSYIKNLLIALRRVHEFKVIHRDIKPSNFLHNRRTGKFLLVDFGLAESVYDDAEQVEKIISKLKRKRAAETEQSPAEDEETKAKRKRISNYIEECSKAKHLASPFKTPLKQVNEKIQPKSPLDSQITSAENDNDANLADKIKGMIEKAHEYVLRLGEASKLGTPTKQTANNPKANPPRCQCHGKNRVCNTCIIGKDIQASRAGTPGYRPPEVLLKHTDQSTAVDIWAVGVIFISILSGVYPFFRAPDDFIALAEIATLFGNKAICEVAKTLNRHVCMSRKSDPLDLRRLCIRLRNRNKVNKLKVSKDEKQEECSNCEQNSFYCLCLYSPYNRIPIDNDVFPSSAYELLEKLLEINPYRRITAAEALEHPFFTDGV